MGRTVYRCLHCTCEYSQYTDLHEHIRSFSDCSSYYEHHRKPLTSAVVHCQREEVSWYCDRCGYVCSSQTGIAEHIRNVQTCRRHYIHKYGRDAYLWTVKHCRSEPDVYECGMCEKQFASLDDLHQHTRARSYCHDVTRCRYCNRAFTVWSEYQRHLRLDSACHIQMNRERADRIKAEKMKHNEQARRLMQQQKEAYPTDSEKSGIRFKATDEAAAVFHKLSNAFNDVELTPDEKINREYMVERFAEWSKLLREHSGTSVELLYPRLNDDLQLVIRNPVGSDEWTLEIVTTGAHITGLPSYDAAYDLAEHIDANREDWVK